MNNAAQDRFQRFLNEVRVADRELTAQILFNLQYITPKADANIATYTNDDLYKLVQMCKHQDVKSYIKGLYV